MGPLPGSNELDGLGRQVEEAYADYVRDLRELVSIDSGSYTKTGVDRVSEWTMGRLSDLGASVARHPNAVLGDTFVANFEGEREGPTVLMVGHADTVFDVGTAQVRPFVIDHGRAFGPGVSDMKGGLLAGIYALTALRGRAGRLDRWLPAGRVIFVVNPDEELGSPASTPIIEGLARSADAALVLEGARPNGDIVSARWGVMHLRVAVHGRAAHAGVEPEMGRSAVLEAAHKILSLHDLADAGEGVRVNVGKIDGGTRPNVVAAEAVMSIDVRARTRARQSAVVEAIRDIARRTTVPGTSASVEVLASHPPMERSEASTRLLGTAVTLAAELGFDLGDAETGGASDANTIAALGIPTLDGLGPIGGHWHAAEEYLELDSIVPRTTLLAGLLLALGRRPGPLP